MIVYNKFNNINIAPKNAQEILIFNSDGNRVGSIPLGNLRFKKDNKLYRFGCLSDVHLPYSTGYSDFQHVLTYFNEIEKVDFICISGDMGSTGVDSDWKTYKSYVDTYSPNTSVHISCGNHDAGYDGKTYDYPIPYTGYPLWYSFEKGDDLFIMFGLTCWNSPVFSEESLQWLYETLEENRNRRVFLFQHAMRKNYSGDANGSYSWDALDNTTGKVFLSLMEHYKNVLWFHGHSHMKLNCQETIPSPIANYDRLFGCHSIHVPGCCFPRDKDMNSFFAESEGYIIDVYENGIRLTGMNFITDTTIPVGNYWIDTALEEIEAKSYVDNYNIITI